MYVWSGGREGKGVYSPFPRWFDLFSIFPNQNASISKISTNQKRSRLNFVFLQKGGMLDDFTLNFLHGRISGMRKVLVGWN